MTYQDLLSLTCNSECGYIRLSDSLATTMMDTSDKYTIETFSVVNGFHIVLGTLKFKDHELFMVDFSLVPGCDSLADGYEAALMTADEDYLGCIVFADWQKSADYLADLIKSRIMRLDKAEHLAEFTANLQKMEEYT